MRPLLPTAAILILATLACGQAIEPPPVEITFRESLLGAGKIVQVKNTRNEPLTEIEIVIRAPDGDERTFVQESIEGYGLFELGWKKLGGWEIPAGSEVEVRAKGFLRAAGGVLPKEGD